MNRAGSTKWGVFIAIAITLTFSNNISFAGNTGQPVYWYLKGVKQVWMPEPNNVTLRINGQVEADALPGSEIEKTNNTTYAHLQLPDDVAAREEYLSDLKKQYPASHLMISFLDEKGKEVSIDERLFVSFKTNISDEELNSFAARYDLHLENPRPSFLSPGWKYVYIFRQNNFSIENNTAVLSGQIYEQESENVAYANPDRVAMPGKGFRPDGTLNDPDLSYAWFLNNQGQQLACASDGGTSGDDAKIEEAWNTGYYGQGIKIGVVDFGGFDYTHPDMQGQLLPGWNCITDSAYDADNAPYDSTFLGHGMAVSGIIGAAGDNGVGSAGVAYGAKLVPFFVNGQEDVQLIIAMQMAVDTAFDVDVLNFSLGIDYPSDAIETQINNLATYGRVRYGVARGVVMVASHGNNSAFDSIAPQWPAAYPQVIGVGGSTPNDELKVTDDQWNLGTVWGSNYGNLMAVVAPSVCIFTTDMTGDRGYSDNDYTGFCETSAAAPIVTGIAAMVLSKNVGLTWTEVKNAITSSADKVHTDLYNYNVNDSMPGHSQQMGYGRVNALNALNNTTTGIDSTTPVEKGTFNLNNPADRQLSIRYQLPENVSRASLQVYDVSGKLLLTQNMSNNSELMNVNVEDLAPGMYFARFTDQQNELMQTIKFIKVL